MPDFQEERRFVRELYYDSICARVCRQALKEREKKVCDFSGRRFNGDARYLGAGSLTPISRRKNLPRKRLERRWCGVGRRTRFFANRQAIVETFGHFDIQPRSLRRDAFLLQRLFELIIRELPVLQIRLANRQP
jgi:hypothetical protein